MAGAVPASAAGAMTVCGARGMSKGGVEAPGLGLI